MVLILFLIGVKKNYYFSDDGYDNPVVGNVKKKENNVQSVSGRTVIIEDNRYEGIKISNVSDANNLISKDSTSQKKNCPKEIIKVENEIIEKYGITAVNLCEMNVNFARELSKVIRKIYDEYPALREHLTNLTLVNGNLTDKSYIAAFMPMFVFANTNTSDGYPTVIKTQILLNTLYYLNLDRLNNSAVDGSKAGHFPPNATVYSPLAHEMGHYISFMAMMRHYNVDSILLIDNDDYAILSKISKDFVNGSYSLSMITEAYNNYKRDTNTTMSLDEWRGTISKYALAKDNNGNYIYDETIAESFHDVYLNGNNAVPASKYVVKVLKERFGN